MRRSLVLTLTLLLGAALPGLGRAQETSSPPAPATAPETAPAGPGSPETAPGQSAEPESTEPVTGTPEPVPTQEAGEETSSLELVRKDDGGEEHRIRIVRTGTSDETGIFTICSPQDGEPEDAPNVAVFSESGTGGVQITIDKNVIRVPLAVVTQRPPREGQEGSDGRVEASAGSATYLDAPPEGKTDRLSRCAVGVDPRPAPDTVLVTQGKTELKGQKLVYDETDGIARIDGPIAFSRPSDDGPLTGKSERIEVDVDEEQTTLVGDVTLNSKGGRVSRAARVEYDDQANTARLIGTPEQPAESRQGSDVLRAQVLLYDLDRNEVVARAAEGGTITAEFQDGEAPPGSASPAPPATP